MSQGTTPAAKFHPPKKFAFPVTDKRKFKSEWCSAFPWLHYSVEKDAAFCFTCMKRNTMIKNVRREPAYTEVGFRTWKNALQSFEKHQRSEYHKIASDQFSVDIGDALSKQHQEEKSVNSKMLLNLLESVRFLGRQGLAFRGDGDDQEGNFIQSLKFLGTADPSVLEWL